eukprot:TRINITY_DN5680_c0_g1_i1.p1 TRINITY_DN5680_c0_g1~~TRINITY_DN5680_c0_g1_i1.p1  ORF type:complete len:315 (-),score=34.10 TRINITY_DN5680_c0_g1_i1:121-1065(-)
MMENEMEYEESSFDKKKSFILKSCPWWCSRATFGCSWVLIGFIFLVISVSYPWFFIEKIQRDYSYDINNTTNLIHEDKQTIWLYWTGVMYRNESHSRIDYDWHEYFDQSSSKLEVNYILCLSLQSISGFFALLSLFFIPLTLILLPSSRFFENLTRGYSKFLPLTFLSLSNLLSILSFSLFTRSPKFFNDIEFCAPKIAPPTSSPDWCESFTGTDKFSFVTNTNSFSEVSLWWGPSYGWDFAVLSTILSLSGLLLIVVARPRYDHYFVQRWGDDSFLNIKSRLTKRRRTSKESSYAAITDKPKTFGTNDFSEHQ